jgi:ribosomal 30S subunit maturation factor RimM
MELIEIGKAVKLHGFIGQMKLNAKFDKDFNLKKIDKMYDEKGNEFAVSRLFQTKDAIVVLLEGVDLEKAKTYINKSFFINRELVSGKILIEDLKGSVVSFENEEEFAKVEDVQDYGAAEVFFVRTKTNKQLMFPNVKGVIVSFDYKTKKLILNKDKFKEVCDYED